jgi:hypothetical protein
MRIVVGMGSESMMLSPLRLFRVLLHPSSRRSLKTSVMSKISS